MRLPRMTSRRWMIIVVVVGLIMAGYDLKRRHDRFLTLARNHSNMGRAWLRYRDQLLAGVGSYDQRFRASLMVYYHANLEAKHLQAARYPWFHVDPDQSPPTPGPDVTVARGPGEPSSKGGNSLTDRTDGGP